MRQAVLRPNQRLYPRFNRFYMDDFFFPKSKAIHFDEKKNSINDVNISKIENAFLIEVAVPGFTKEDIKISLEDDRLKIRGKKAVEERVYIKRAFKLNEFEQIFNLPKTVDLNNIEATVSNGILSIILNKLDEKPQLQIQVK